MAETVEYTIHIPEELANRLDAVDADGDELFLLALATWCDRMRERRSRQAIQARQESEEWERASMQDWLEAIPFEDVEGLVDMNTGTPVRWLPDGTWVEG